MKLIAFSFVFFLCMSLISCSSAWELIDVPASERPYRICRAEIDGEERHLKGFCYRQTYLRKRPLISDLVRYETLFCSFEDPVCINRFVIEDRVLVPR